MPSQTATQILTNGELTKSETDVNGNQTAISSGPSNGSHKPALGPGQPLPKVADLDLATAKSIEHIESEIIESLRLSGGCVIRNMVGKDALDEMEKEIRPHLNAAKPWNGDFWPPETRKVMGVLGKSKSFALNVVGNPIWQNICKHFLTSKLEWNWVGTKQEQSTSSPQLNNTVVFSIRPGAAAQVLHRDDPVHHNYGAAAPTHSLGRDTAAGFFVAGTRTTRANGATRFVPGSHLWDYSVPPPAEPKDDDNQTEDPCFYAELEPGDGFMVLAGCYHAGSANRTEDEERLVYSTFSTRGYLRQEENQYLANEVERVRELPVWLQRFAGYSLSRPFMGWVEMDDPMRVIDPGCESLEELW